MFFLILSQMYISTSRPSRHHRSQSSTSSLRKEKEKEKEVAPLAAPLQISLSRREELLLELADQFQKRLEMALARYPGNFMFCFVFLFCFFFCIFCFSHSIHIFFARPFFCNLILYNFNGETAEGLQLMSLTFVCTLVSER